MADFNQAVQKTLVHEGGYQANTHDTGNWVGGKATRDAYLASKDPALLVYLKGTKFGITCHDLPDVEIKDLTVEQAIEYYREHYWKPLYSQIVDQSVAEKLFDLGVLFGVKVAVKILQITIAQDMSIVSDGVFGPTTLSDVNQEGPDLLPRYKTVFIQHCINIVNNNPDDGVFVNGWIGRINS